MTTVLPYSFDQTTLAHLRGEKFSNGLRVPISAREDSVPDRIQLVEQVVAGATVLHLGCCDHLPLIDVKIQHDTWLHGRLSRVAGRCMGLDTNAEAVSYVTDVLGYRDVLCADLVGETIQEVVAQKWDYLVAGEVLEHLDNPLAFLRQVALRYTGMVTRILITVPNATGMGNVRAAFAHQEFINTDHRYWFTPFTLAKILVQAGIEPECFGFCEPFKEPQSSWLRRPRGSMSRVLLKRYPGLREGLVMVGRIPQ